MAASSRGNQSWSQRGSGGGGPPLGVGAGARLGVVPGRLGRRAPAYGVERRRQVVDVVHRRYKCRQRGLETGLDPFERARRRDDIRPSVWNEETAARQAQHSLQAEQQPPARAAHHRVDPGRGRNSIANSSLRGVDSGKG